MENIRDKLTKEPIQNTIEIYKGFLTDLKGLSGKNIESKVCALLDDAVMKASKQYRLSCVKGIELAHDEFQKKLAKVSKLFPNNFTLERTTLSDEMVAYLAEQTMLYEDFEKKYIDERILSGALEEYRKAGMTWAKTLQMIEIGFETYGITKTKDYHVKTVHNTAMMDAYSAETWDITQKSDHVWGYKYHMGLTIRHQDLDGITAPKNDPIWSTIWPPNGFNCACWVETIFYVEEPEKSQNIPAADKLKDFVDEGFDKNNLAYSMGGKK